MKKLISFFKTDIKIINSYFLFAIILIILVCIGYSSYALFSFTKTSNNVIEGTVGELKKSGVDTLIKLTDNTNDSGLYTITHAADSTLQIGANESITEYRYRGASPKNYVTFNNETWRILGVFPTDDGTGNIENRVKIIRDQSIGNKSWDNGTTAYNYTKNDNLMLLQDKNKLKVEYLEKTNKYDVMLTAPEFCDGVNNWARPASLNTELNTTYLNSLDSTSKSMIGQAKYYLGGYETASIATQDMYSYERKISGTAYYNDTNPNNWIGKIGLMYVSDYGYASSDCNNSTNLESCNNQNWLNNIISLNTNYSDSLTITASITSDAWKGISSFYIYNHGIGHRQVCGTGSDGQIFPTLYLKSNVLITGGDGTSSNPYKLSINIQKATDKLITLTNNKDNSGLYTITHPKDTTLQIGNDKDITEYRYRGASPKNYVTFNNETWRILGVFPTDDGTGKIENRIKLIRNESVGDKYWNNCTSTNDLQCDDTNKYYNDWTGATLNTYLNGTYLNSLDSTSKSLISNAKYYLGGLGVEAGTDEAALKASQTTGVQLYNYERKIKNGTKCYKEDLEGVFLYYGTECYYYGTNPNSWTGKIALMYSSDYFYASANCENKMMMEAYIDDNNDTQLTETSTKDIRACNDTNWLYNLKVNEWHLPQFSFVRYHALSLASVGIIGNLNVRDDQCGARPVLYLTSSAKITGGSGTSTNPYTLGL